MIRSLEKYILEVNSINENWGIANSTTHAWYRGQSNYSWDLQPSIYRGAGSSEHEHELVRDFKLNASRFIHHLPDSDFGWLYLMQHYGIPTRLIDWTENYLVALYFAVLDFDSSSNAAVWLLDPWFLNLCNLGQQSIPIDNYPALNDYVLNMDPIKIDRKVKGEYPIALRPVRVSPRIIAQKGVFTVHGYNHISLGIAGTLKNAATAKFEKIKICGKSKLNILKELYMAGISHSALFPEMEGLAKEISFRYSLELKTGSHRHKGF